MPYFSSLRLSCCKMGARPGLDFVSPKNWLYVIINDDFLEMGVCYEYLHKADHA